jgi:hypothetical protein
MTYDLLIKNGCVVDGSGGPSFYADVAVHSGKIVGVGKFNIRWLDSKAVGEVHQPPLRRCACQKWGQPLRTDVTCCDVA